MARRKDYRILMAATGAACSASRTVFGSQVDTYPGSSCIRFNSRMSGDPELAVDVLEVE